MNGSIVHEVASQRQRLQTAAGTTSDPAELRRIATAMENVTRAMAIVEAGAIQVITVTDHGMPAIVAVGDGRTTMTVVIGRRSDRTPWACSCATQAAAYNAACCHKLAARLLLADLAHQHALATRAALVGDLAAAQAAYDTATQARAEAERQLAAARAEEARTWAIVRGVTQALAGEAAPPIIASAQRPAAPTERRAA